MWIFVVLFFFIKIFFSSIKSRFYIFNFSNSVLFFNFVQLQFCPYCPILSYYIFSDIVQFCPKCPTLFIFVQNAQLCPKCPILSILSNYSKLYNFIQNVQFCPKWSILPKMSNFVQNVHIVQFCRFSPHPRAIKSKLSILFLRFSFFFIFWIVTCHVYIIKRMNTVKCELF